MSFVKLPPWRMFVWLGVWSLVFFVPPALAVMAARGASPDAGGWEARSAADGRADQPGAAAHEARRLLIDWPGDSALATVVEDLLYFDAPGGDPGTADDAEEQDVGPLPSTVPLTPELSALRDKVRKALLNYYPKHLSAQRNTPWEVMHGIIAYGVDTQIFKDRPGGDAVNAIGWMCYNNPCAGQRMLFLNGGQVDAGRGVGVQGHAGQFLAILAQSRVKADYPLLVEGKHLTLADLIEREKSTCVSGEELTFKLIALMHYLDSDATWKARDGQEWSIPRLIREELRAPIRGAACGGTHRLMGFSYAVNKRAARGKPIDGEYLRARKYLQDYHRYTFSLQNEDGSFSTAWFERRGNEQSMDRKIKTTGHILEWIAFSLSDEELRDPRMIKAADFLSTLLLANEGHTWEIGPLGHALHGLSIYNERMFKDPLPPNAAPLAGRADAAAREARLDGNDRSN